MKEGGGGMKRKRNIEVEGSGMRSITLTDLAQLTRAWGMGANKAIPKN